MIDLKNRETNETFSDDYEGLNILYDDFGEPSKFVVAELTEGYQIVDTAAIWNDMNEEI